MIAEKREVAALVAGFPWSECHVMKTGDKSLYKNIDLRKAENRVNFAESG